MRRTSTIAAAMAAVALLAQAVPAAAQNASGYYAQTCRSVRSRLVCGNADWSGDTAGSHAYERWSNGSPARGSGTSPDVSQFPQYLGGHNSWYGFGR